MLDLDRFQQVNELYGHRAGDTLLRKVAERIDANARTGDTAARLGGDEFAILFERLRAPEEANAMADRIIKAFEAPFSILGHEFRITGSLGLSLYPEDASDPAALVRNADTALHLSKTSGRNVFHRYSPKSGMLALERMEIERNLQGAVERGEFEVHYQLQF